MTDWLSWNQRPDGTTEARRRSFASDTVLVGDIGAWDGILEISTKRIQKVLNVPKIEYFLLDKVQDRCNTNFLEIRTLSLGKVLKLCLIFKMEPLSILWTDRDNHLKFGVRIKIGICDRYMKCGFRNVVCELSKMLLNLQQLGVWM